ncbi:DUF7536 family protein [Halocatena salina]|uniref:Uncharacterized protein n=1 Tax=Halocatena salina TaxID=2934340 RepID=A0A8T9ZZK0_9EURY|nr:hypothetical protein [Halocatena salina]UPM41946.1 hypothetical protein MW046_08175 [Halocatena salina]
MDDSIDESVTADRSGTAAFFDALRVARNGKIGVAVGVVFGVLMYVVRVFELRGPAPDGVGGPLLFLALAFVLAFGTAVLVTIILTVISAYQAVRRVE